MRKAISRGGMLVNCISGTYVVLLGMDISENLRKGLLGFAIHRIDHKEKERYWLKGFKTFEATMPHPAPGQLVSTREHPVQDFHWGDYTAKPEHEYTYRVVPIYGNPRHVDAAEERAVEVSINTESERKGAHSVFFNRGVSGSQAYVRKFGDTKPNNEEAFKWLSRGLEEALIRFIDHAHGERYALRASVYEFNYPPVLEAFKRSSDSGADVKIIYDCRDSNVRTKSCDAIRSAGIEHLMIPRKKNPSYISHNKFIVLLRDDEPTEVWTGSANFTDGGIFGQSNVGHIVRNKKVARCYLDYWNELSQDAGAREFKHWIDEHNPLPEINRRCLDVVFSPRKSIDAMELYADMMDNAQHCVNFTAAFGVNTYLFDVLKHDKDYLRFLILDNAGSQQAMRDKTKVIIKDRENLVAIGSYIGSDNLHRWMRERLTGLNTHVRYIHTKYMLIDALGNDPIVISGSANFSENSTLRNDENMLVIRGNTRVADIYLGEFMRLFNHYYFRNVANRVAGMNKQRTDGNGGRRKSKIKLPYLVPSDAWTAPFFDDSSVKFKERLLFSGKYC